MATHDEKRRRLGGRLEIIIREFEAWTAKRRLKKLTERFMLTLTVADGFEPATRPPKKEYKRCKPTGRKVGKKRMGYDTQRHTVFRSGHTARAR